MTRYNSGHTRVAFATRVRMLRQHPELWRQVPGGITRQQWMRDPALRQLWREVHAFMRANCLISANTDETGLNVAKIVAAVRELDDRERATAARLEAARG